MIAVIYVRVSTDEQAQKGLSIPAQIEHCEKYAQQNGFSVARIFQDEGESATSANRPEFLEMIDYCKTKGDVAAVIVYDTSRFARNREDAVVFKRMLEKRGVKVHYASQIISDDPEGKFLEGMLEVIDEHYSRALARVVRRGMVEAVKRGNWMGGPPFGYMVVRDKDGKRRLQIEPRQAEAVRLVFNLHERGYGSKKISEMLNDRGYKTQLGKIFRCNNVDFILRNPAYTGTTVFNRFRRGHRAKRSLIPAQERVVVPNTHEALVTRAQFDEVQEELKRRGEDRKPGELKTLRRFAGLVQCSRCGRTAAATTGTSRHGALYFYYGCQTRLKKSIKLCKGFTVRAERLENTVIEAVDSEVFSEKNVDAFLAYVKARAQELDNGRSGEKIRIQRKLEAVQGKLRKVVLLAEDDVIDVEEARRRTKELHEEREELMDRYARLQDELSLKDAMPTKGMLEAAKKELRRIVTEAEPRMQREFFKRFIKSIKTDGESAEVVYNLAGLISSTRNSIHVSAPKRS